MSFWKRTILGSNKPEDNLPNSSNAATTIQTDSTFPQPSEAAAMDQSASVGPPPIATAYTYPTPPRVSSQKASPRETPPTFHIFEPKQQEFTDAHSDTMEDKESVNSDADNDNDSAESADEETNENHNPEEAMADSLYETEDTHHTHQRTDSVDYDISTPTQPDLTHDDCSSSSKDLQEDESQNISSEDAVHILPEELEEPVVTPSQTALVPQDETPVAQEGTPLSPKFGFLNDSVPLKELIDSTSKRRHESQSRIHQLDCKLASLQAKLANVSMDRGKAMPTLNSLVNQRLESLVENFGNQLLSPPDAPIHSRLAKLESTRMRHVHVELPDTLADELESPYNEVTIDLQSQLRLETSKADKRIGTLVRRYETIAGAVARRHVEEAASMRAALVQVQSLSQDAADLDELQARQFLDSLEAMRKSLEREREERKARDEKVMALIEERTVELKRALLEAAGST